MSYSDTLGLTMDEVADLLEWTADEKTREARAAFKKG